MLKIRCFLTHLGNTLPAKSNDCVALSVLFVSCYFLGEVIAQDEKFLQESVLWQKTPARLSLFNAVYTAYLPLSQALSRTPREALRGGGSGSTNAFSWTSFFGRVTWTLSPAETTSSFITEGGKHRIERETGKNKQTNQTKKTQPKPCSEKLPFTLSLYYLAKRGGPGYITFPTQATEDI